MPPIDHEPAAPIEVELSTSEARAWAMLNSEAHHPRVAQQVVAELFGEPDARSFSVRYWTGDLDEPAEPGAALFTMRLLWPGALRRMLLPATEVRLAEGYVRGDCEIEGDLEAATAMADSIAARLHSPRRLLRVVRWLLQLPQREARQHQKRSQPSLGAWAPWRRLTAGRRHARARDAQAVCRHYDLGNDFYALWLDEDLSYSCAYFATGREDLHSAQRAKFDLICRKLRLRPGERLLDIGCGWGGLIRYAVRHHGIHALGITLSQEQANLARERIAHDGLADRCAVEVRDYRDLPRDLEVDKVVSIGMCEHVGRARIAEYFATAMRIVRPGGLFLNHGIVSLEQARESGPSRRLWGSGRFIDRYVFPDSELLTLAVMTRAAEAAGFETRDVESLREHYVDTLRHWMRRLDARAVEARAIVGDATLRVWRLYMAGAARAFATGRIGVAQQLLARPNAAGGCCHPRSRADVYGRLPA